MTLTRALRTMRVLVATNGSTEAPPHSPLDATAMRELREAHRAPRPALA